MPLFLAEVYLPESQADDARVTGRRARDAAAELAAEQAHIRYIRTTYLPDDETCLHLFEASSSKVVHEAMNRAGLGWARVTAALEASESNGESRT